MADDFSPDQVLDFWFPDDGHWQDMERHRAFWTWRTQGGADEDIKARFADLTLAAARGLLDHWAGTPRGRLALILALDQFPRSLWRDTPGAYGQDIKATRLALEGIENGHFAALDHVWERQFYIIAITHCEGPDHLARMELVLKLTEASVANIPEAISDYAERARSQRAKVRDIIARFGRHPHRNAILGRVSTPEEEAYIAAGDFPHVAKPEAES